MQSTLSRRDDDDARPIAIRPADEAASSSLVVGPPGSAAPSAGRAERIVWVLTAVIEDLRSGQAAPTAELLERALALLAAVGPSPIPGREDAGSGGGGGLAAWTPGRAAAD